MKKSLFFGSFIASCLMSFALLSGSAFAWIGSGTGGSASGGGGGGGGGGCNGKYGIGCAGVSWAFYKAQAQTDNWTEFPYINQSLRVVGASIPPECSNSGGGFWHFGINSFGAYYGDGDEIWTTTDEWAREYGSPWWGHWLTINPGHSMAQNAPYNTSEVWVPQWVGVYKMDHYGSWDDARRAYQEAWAYESGRPIEEAPGDIPGDVWGFCWGEYMKEKTLTVYAKVNNDSLGGTKSGDYLNDGNPVIGPTKYPANSEVEIKSEGIEFLPGYSFANWGISNADMPTYTKQSSNTTRNITWKSLTSDTVLDVYYWKDTFAGRSRVGLSSSDLPYKAPNNDTGITTDWASNSYKCTTVNCRVKLAHEINRIYGTGQTKYTITRYTNVPGLTSGVITQNATTGLNSNNSLTRVRTSDEYTLGYGQFVCETMVFHSTTIASPTRALTMVCAYGADRPAATSSLSIDVKDNDGAETYKTYQDVVYAKPKDNLTYRAVYNPAVQAFANDRTQKMKINNGSLCTAAYNNYLTSMVSSAFYSPCGGGVWANGFRVYSERFNGSQFAYNYRYTIGDSATKTETNDHRVKAIEVGSSLDEFALTNSSGGVNTVPKSASWTTQCLTGVARDENGNTFRNESGSVVQVTFCYQTISINKDPMEDKDAHARIPYNFENTTRMTTCNAADAKTYGMTCANYSNSKHSNLDASKSSANVATLYAGEDFRFHFDTITSPRYNSATNGTYATIVPGAKIKLQYCLNAECNSTSNYERADRQTTPTASNGTIKDLNANTSGDANYDGTVSSPEDKSIEMNIPDVPAGTKMCVRSAVYPANSGAATNYTDKEGSHTWAYSAPVCFTIAKKPTIQVWGGNVYANGAIATSDSEKKSLDGYGEYTIENGSVKHVFGSWGELGVMANGNVDRFGSGASMGYAAISSSGVLTPSQVSNSGTPSPGGSSVTNVCKHSPLTFANCVNSTTPGNMGNTVTASSIDGDKEGILVKYDYGGDGGDGVVSLNVVENIKDGTYYYYGNNLTLPASTVDKGTIQIVRAKGDIRITGDITYSLGDGYRKLSDVPKLILYAEKDILISCDVGRVDAVLIASGKVSTCAEANNDNQNTRERSLKQLVINGAVIAAKLDALRTYGAATGANSIVPAEIINFDPTLYRWGGEDPSSSSTDGGASGSAETSIDLDVTYQKELAPRL